MIDRLFYATAIVAASAAFALATAEQVEVFAAQAPAAVQQAQPVAPVVELQRVVIRASAADRIAALQATDSHRAVN
jgi:ACR3 family arsenite efflux pump ArsB